MARGVGLKVNHASIKRDQRVFIVLCPYLCRDVELDTHCNLPPTKMFLV